MIVQCPTCHQEYSGNQTSGGHHNVCHQSFNNPTAFEAHLKHHKQGTCLDVTTSPDWMLHPNTNAWTLVKAWVKGQEYWAKQ